MKKLLLSALTHDFVTPLFRPFARGVAPVLFLHRFADPETGRRGHSPDALRANLALLRRKGYKLISLVELLEALEEGRPLDRTVVFTIDDGYADFSRVAVPIFAEFDCPATLFLTTGFVDGDCWCWWDRITVALEQTTHRSLTLELGGAPVSVRWSTPAERIVVETELQNRCKQLPTLERHAALDRIALALEVEIPDRPTSAFAPMTWAEVRAAALRGITFGPHTVTHPILSRAQEDEAHREITVSWRRVREETDAAIPIFCYPNGTPDSYGPREFALLQRAGLAAALTTEQRYTSSTTLVPDTAATRFAIPRFGYSDERDLFVQVVSGIERAKQAVRSAFSA